MCQTCTTYPTYAFTGWNCSPARSKMHDLRIDLKIPEDLVMKVQPEGRPTRGRFPLG